MRNRIRFAPGRPRDPAYRSPGISNDAARCVVRKCNFLLDRDGCAHPKRNSRRGVRVPEWRKRRAIHANPKQRMLWHYRIVPSVARPAGCFRLRLGIDTCVVRGGAMRQVSAL